MVIVALLLAGCAKFQTARECGVFVAAMNEWKAVGEKPQAGVSANAAAPLAPPLVAPPLVTPPTRAQAALETRKIADRYERLAKRIDDLHLMSAELLPRAERYRRLAREAAAALRDVAQAVETGDAESGRRRRVEFDDLARGEAALVADINAVCR